MSVSDSPHLWLENPSISVHASFSFTGSCLSATLTRKFDEFSPIRSHPELKITELKLVVLVTSPCSHLGAYGPPHCLLEGHGITCSQSALLPQLLRLCLINSFRSLLSLPLPLRIFRDTLSFSLDGANWVSRVMLYVLWRSFV